MADNDKLTSVLEGRTLSGTGNANDTLTVHFTDGSKMMVKTKGSTNSASTGGTIQSAKQTAETLTLTMEGGGSLDVPLADDPSPVTVHDEKGAAQYGK